VCVNANVESRFDIDMGINGKVPGSFYTTRHFGGSSRVVRDRKPEDNDVVLADGRPPVAEHHVYHASISTWLC